MLNIKMGKIIILSTEIKPIVHKSLLTELNVNRSPVYWERPYELG